MLGPSFHIEIYFIGDTSYLSESQVAKRFNCFCFKGSLGMCAQCRSVQSFNGGLVSHAAKSSRANSMKIWIK